MDTRAKLKTAIVEWQESALPFVHIRNRPIQMDLPHIHDIIGVRRCGKTYFMYQLISDLLMHGVPKSSVLYLNLDDDRLQPIQGDELSQLIDTFRELYASSDDQKIYFFLDEIQNFPLWEKWLKGIYDKRKNIKFVISGSNASLLSEDISSRLTGRHLTTRMFPFSFFEFLKYKNISFDLKTIAYSDKKIEIKRIFNEYLVRGGFPEVIIYPAGDHITLLQSYFDDIIYRDIVSRHGVRNPKIFKELALFCVSNIAKPHTYNSLKRLFSDYQSLSTDAIIRYLSYLEDAFLLFSVNHYDTSLKRQIQKPKKLYCIDHGMMQAVSFRFSNDIGRIFENIVYIALLRQGKEIYYWQDEKGVEVDFVIKSRDDSIRLIQVSVDISDPMTREREKRGLISAMNYFEIGEGIIITSDILDEEIFQDRKITYFPLWFWLLTEESESYI
jgi:predicted AAA+ superfamily ATPase